MNKPVMYLDVDGVLWDIADEAPIGKNFIGAHGVVDFMIYALKHFEVRWCTTWAMGGSMTEEDMQRLEDYTAIPLEWWRLIKPGKGWWDSKSTNIFWEEHEEGRPFVWVEDGLLPQELQELDQRGFLNNYIHVDVFEDPHALEKAIPRLVEVVRMARGTSLEN